MDNGAGVSLLKSKTLASGWVFLQCTVHLCQFFTSLWLYVDAHTLDALEVDDEHENIKLFILSLTFVILLHASFACDLALGFGLDEKSGVGGKRCFGEKSKETGKGDKRVGYHTQYLSSPICTIHHLVGSTFPGLVVSVLYTDNWRRAMVFGYIFFINLVSLIAQAQALIVDLWRAVFFATYSLLAVFFSFLAFSGTQHNHHFGGVSPMWLFVVVAAVNHLCHDMLLLWTVRELEKIGSIEICETFEAKLQQRQRLVTEEKELRQELLIGLRSLVGWVVVAVCVIPAVIYVIAFAKDHIHMRQDQVKRLITQIGLGVFVAACVVVPCCICLVRFVRKISWRRGKK